MREPEVLTADRTATGKPPTGATLPVREVRVARGAAIGGPGAEPGGGARTPACDRPIAPWIEHPEASLFRRRPTRPGITPGGISVSLPGSSALCRSPAPSHRHRPKCSREPTFIVDKLMRMHTLSSVVPLTKSKTPMGDEAQASTTQ